MNENPRLVRRTTRASLLFCMVFMAACVGEAQSPAAAPETGVAQASEPRATLAGGFGRYLAGRHAQIERDSAAAADYYRSAAEIDRDNAALLRRAYFFMVADGRLEDAVPLAERALLLDGTDQFAPMVLAVAAVRENDVPRARSLIDPLPATGLNAFIAPMLKAWLAQAEGKTDAALEALEPLKGRSHFRPLYEFHAGLILDVAGKPTEAGAHFDRLIESGNSSTLRTTQLVAGFRVRQGARAAALGLFDKYRESNRDSLIVDELEKAFRADTADTQPIGSATEGLAEAFFTAASSVRQGNGFEAAQFLGELALALKSDFMLAQGLIAEVLELQEQYAAANEAYARIPADSFLYLSARLRIADNLDRIKRHDEAVAELRALSEAYPAREDPLVTMGDILRRNKKFAESVDAYDKAIGRLGETVEKARWPLFYARGIALERSKQWERAEADFLRALEMEPDQPLVLNYLGYSWLEMGRNIDRATAMIRKAVEQRPRDGYIVDSLGWGYYRIGRFEDAVRELEKAIELTPDDPTINDHLGDAYWKVGRRNEARFQWERALVMEPEDEADRKKIEAKIKLGLDAVEASLKDNAQVTTSQ